MNTFVSLSDVQDILFRVQGFPHLLHMLSN